MGGSAGIEKASTIVKSGLSGTDVVIRTSHALQDYACSDFVCCTISAIESASSAIGLIISNIPNTKYLTIITGSVTVSCRCVRYYCKKYGTFWGCTIAAGQELKETVKFIIKK